MHAREMGTFLSIFDGTLKAVPVSDLDKEGLKGLVAEKRGLTLLDLKKRSDYSSITTTSGECFDEQETLEVPTLVADADDHPSEIASSIPPIETQVLTLEHSAF